MSRRTPSPVYSERQPCTCWALNASTARQICPACHAWEHSEVVLQDGQRIPRAVWVRAHEASQEHYIHSQTRS